MAAGMALLQKLGLGIVPSTQAAFVFRRSNRNGSDSNTNGDIPRRSSQQQKQKQKRSKFRSCRCHALSGLSETVEGLQSLYHGLVPGIGVGLPYQVMDYGDAVYRSALPKQGIILTAPGLLLSLLVVVTYLWSSKPGVAPGFWDMFVLGKLEQFIRPTYRKEDSTLGKCLEEAAFGTVDGASLVHKQAGKMNVHDQFGRYSSSLTFLQMTFPNLRHDSALISFNRQLKRCDYKLALWRENTESCGNTELRHGFENPDVASKPGRGRPVCALTKSWQPATEEPENLVKEAHKYFDQVVITVRSGDGGHGSLLDMPKAPAPARYTPGDKSEKPKKPEKGKKKTGALKRGSDGSLELPMGGHGGDVIIIADEKVDTLLELHKKKRYNAKRGNNVNASGPLTPMLRDGLSAPTLFISVPVGTVVKRRKGGKLLGDLSRVGDKCLVARGGAGGISMVAIPKQNRRPLKNVDPAIIADSDDKALTLGGTGEEMVLELTLRVVADVGLVGLPNAGKSSLLAAVTRATPNIADYPFTTLMPNLGRLPGVANNEDGGYAAGATLADLPGLIKGAHLGKGLGRVFLRHLRRTRLLLHVVDASADDPIRDYKTLREELYMYNPDYGRRPHIVVLNKLDLLKASSCFDAIRETISTLGTDPEMASLEEEPKSSGMLPVLQSDSVDNIPMEDDNLGDAFVNKTQQDLVDFRRPVDVVGISAKQGSGMEELLSSISVALEMDETKVKKKPRREARPQLYKPPQWQI